MEKIIETLFVNAKSLKHYPLEDMHPVPEMKPFGFFPGGYGMYNESVQIDKIKYMLLGQDFDTLEHFNKLSNDGENKEVVKTWIYLIGNNTKKGLLQNCDINPNECFFTNAIMGLRVSGKNSGASPAWKHPEFIDECKNFFVNNQLSLFKNLEIIFVMGKEVAHFIANTSSPNEFPQWHTINRIADLYDENYFRCIDYNGRKIKFIFMTHPSLANSNLSKRWGRDGKGYKKEIEYIRKALN